MEIYNDERQTAEAHSEREQNHTSANILLQGDLNILLQGDLNYIIDTVGAITNNGIENYYLYMPISENETPQLIPENDVNKESLISTPMLSSSMTFSCIVNECNYLNKSTIILSDKTLKIKPIRTQRNVWFINIAPTKKQRWYVKKAITWNRITTKSNWLDEKSKVVVNLVEAIHFDPENNTWQNK